MTISYFRNNKAEKPDKDIQLSQFLADIKTKWRGVVEKLRETQSKKLKDTLPAITVSGRFKTRKADVPLDKKLIAHSGFIAIDIDAKDNPKMSTTHVIDHECAAQFVSCRGEGLKIIYKCKQVYTQAEHWRIYDAIVERLQAKRIQVKVDSIVKSIASLQYVTYDPEPYVNLDTKLIIKPLPPIKVKKFAAKVDVKKELATLDKFIKELGKKDVTTDYEDWNNIAFGLSYALGEQGREIFHKLSKNYKGYSKSECDEKFDSHLQRDVSTINRPITLATVYDILAENVSPTKAKELKTQKGVAVGPGTGEECPDLANMVQYRLFLFKKICDKETLAVKALLPHSINPIAFGKLLMANNIFRFENSFIRITNNVVEKVDAHTILYMVSRAVEKDGNYEFTYKGERYVFGWEDLLYIWKQAKNHTSLVNAIASEVVFWEQDLLVDTKDTAYIPYQNGVVEITAKSVKILPYEKIGRQIWKDRILPREYKQAKKPGMFAAFFGNVLGRGKKPERSLEYQRNLWYFAYMLHRFKDPSRARAWMLYDIKTGNAGGTGKSLLGLALGKIRYVTMIDGKQIDYRNRFWLQTVKPWTEIIFIDDPRVNTSIDPMFNMITNGVVADRKGLPPVEVDAKFAFASNWVMAAGETSEARRQFISQLDDYYLRYAATHGNTVNPIVHAHGKRFFTDWDANDWNQFDTFCVQALQYYFKTPPPADVIMGNTMAIQFIQKHGEESYHDFAKLFFAKADLQKGFIVRDLLVQAVREKDPTLNYKNSGSVARDFLKSLGIKDIKVSTTYQRGVPVNVYSWDIKMYKIVPPE